MATLTTYLVSDILQIISDLRGESSVNTNSDRIRAISRAEQDVARRQFFRKHLVKDQSLASGDGTTSTFTIGSATYPMRDKGLTDLFVGGTTEDKRRSVVDYEQFRNLYNTNNAERIAYEYYDQANDLWKVKINPIPASGNAITASWYYIPPTRTLTTDAVVCGDPYLIAYLAVADVYHGEDEIDFEDSARQEAENRYREMVGRENTPAVNQSYTMAKQVNKGYGSY